MPYELRRHEWLLIEIRNIADLRRLWPSLRIVSRQFDLGVGWLFECCAYSKTANPKLHLPLAQATGLRRAEAAQTLAERLIAAGYPPQEESND